MENNLPTIRSCTRAYIDYLVGNRNHVRIVLNNQDTVAPAAQTIHQFRNLVNVAGMQAGARLIEYVGDVGQAAAKIANHLDPL
ncbi:hypothetical protein DRW48_05590 [Paracoccus suum]|uniref:Uncharacterized protein n=1 Tax=Paracoccus suum TaxID=2259340 RepID=A0A344PIM0_9RHOB|nr:hypothetical protein DRW48_05590 [Paracoccus suum]